MIDRITSNLVRVHHMPPTTTIIKQFSQELKTYLNEQYITPLSHLDSYRARKEFKLVKSIKLKLKKENYILRPTDKSGIFHLGHGKDYELKAEAYRQKTQAYIELENNPLLTTLDIVTRLLNELRSKQLIYAKHLNEMMPKRDKVELAYLYFLPKPHKEGTPLRPIVSSIKTPTTAISKFLDKLIRPLFDEHVHRTTIIDAVDLIHRLDKYVQNGYLKPTTHFCTFDITDLYTMLPQGQSLEILKEFLVQYGYQRVKEFSIDTILELGRIVLTENVFTYEKKFYRKIVGGAMGSAFTLTLANIFMWKWEKQLARHQLASNEIYGRYIDDIFFTSNESLETIHQMLNEANEYHTNIKITSHINRKVSFLDLCIENKNGILATSVYHKEATEPYVVPFKSYHSRHIFSNIINTILTRAIRYSSTFSTFNDERCSIKLMLLYKGYPPRYIHTQFLKFFNEHISITSTLLFIDTAHDFQFIQSYVLNKPTPAQSQMASRIARAVKSTEENLSNNFIDKSNIKKPSKWNNNLIIHYTHEQRFTSLKRDIHRLWNQFLKNPITNDIRFIVGHQNNRKLQRGLTNLKPTPETATDTKPNGETTTTTTVNNH